MERGLSLDNVEAILVTHEHLDHIRGLGKFCKYQFTKVYTTKKLHDVLAKHSYTKDYIGSCRCILEHGVWNRVGEFEVRWFEVPHDATQTVGFAIKYGDRLLVHMTDLDKVPAEAIELSRKADSVIIESNYDRHMLDNGPYPPELKRRILEEGHLSNDDCAQAIKDFLHPGLRNLFLCHLSGNNNTPEKAYDSARRSIEECGVQCGSINLRVLQRGMPGPLIDM